MHASIIIIIILLFDTDTDKHVLEMIKNAGGAPTAPVAPWMFAIAGQQHSKKYVFMLLNHIPGVLTCTNKLTHRYGTTKEQFAKVAVKNHQHSVNNPYAQFQDEYSLEEILQSKEICDPLTVGIIKIWKYCCLSRCLNVETPMQSHFRWSSSCCSS